MDETSDAIREWPEDMRPREKLLSRGESSLSDAELLAIVLRVGARGRSAVSLARTLLARFGGSLQRLAGADVVELTAVEGMGVAKVAQLKAAVELGRRMLAECDAGECIRSAEEVKKRFFPRLKGKPVEEFWVLFLNSRNRVLAEEQMDAGTPSCAYPHLRAILARALAHFATGIICVHNHPSGSVEPSPEDVAFTRRLRTACETMDIRMLDHVIVGSSDCYSMAEHGRL